MSCKPQTHFNITNTQCFDFIHVFNFWFDNIYFFVVFGSNSSTLIEFSMYQPQIVQLIAKGETSHIMPFSIYSHRLTDVIQFANNSTIFNSMWPMHHKMNSIFCINVRTQFFSHSIYSTAVGFCSKSTTKYASKFGNETQNQLNEQWIIIIKNSWHNKLLFAKYVWISGRWSKYG